MAETYQFPDEIEQTAELPEVKAEIEAKPADFEIEIEDDTPKEDRRRRNLPEDVVQDLEKDEMEQYGDEVKDRLKQLKKVWHDERRAKEQALREQEEAIAATQKLYEENKKMRALLSSGEQEYVAAVKNSVELELDKAKRMYREAYESGDTDRIIEAQENMVSAMQKQERINNFKMPPLQKEENEVKTQYQAPPKPDFRAQKWQEANPWFGQDEEMTASALGLHEKLKRNGVHVGSDEYYATLDRTMRKRFPENFEEEVIEVKETPKAKAPTVVAPASRSTNAKPLKLKTSQVALAKKLGITPEQYAREVLKLGE
jgi:ribosomal protein L32E